MSYTPHAYHNGSRIPNLKYSRFRILHLTKSSVWCVWHLLMQEGEEADKNELSLENIREHLKPPPRFNFEFAGFVESNLRKLSEPIKGKKHYRLWPHNCSSYSRLISSQVSSSLGIHPKHQGKGLGTRLSQRCLEIADAAGLPTFLTAFPGARDLYLRMGFEVVREFHADLSEWTETGKGYGIYTWVLISAFGYWYLFWWQRDWYDTLGGEQQASLSGRVWGRGWEVNWLCSATRNLLYSTGIKSYHFQPKWIHIFASSTHK